MFSQCKSFCPQASQPALMLRWGRVSGQKGVYIPAYTWAGEGGFIPLCHTRIHTPTPVHTTHPRTPAVHNQSTKMHSIRMRTTRLLTYPVAVSVSGRESLLRGFCHLRGCLPSQCKPPSCGQNDTPVKTLPSPYFLCGP